MTMIEEGIIRGLNQDMLLSTFCAWVLFCFCSKSFGVQLCCTDGYDGTVYVSLLTVIR